MRCIVCDGAAFTFEDGIKTCDICGTQLDGFVACESQEYFSEINRSRLIRLKTPKPKNDLSMIEEDTESWSDIEVYNHILIEWTKVLKGCGASSNFEKIILELWILYLQRSGAAFSEDNDAEDLVDFTDCKTPILIKKRYCYFPCRSLSTSIPHAINVDFGEECRPEVMSFEKLLALLYLAVLLSEESILLMDLIRWCREGHIPYLSAHNLLPPDCKRYVPWPSFIASSHRINDHTKVLAVFLNIVHFPMPDMESITDRIVNLLRLPEFVGAVVLEHMKKLLEDNSIVPVIEMELYVIAALIAVVKAYWGMNDSDETHLSRAAERINKEIGTKTSVTPLFCWETWHRFINKLMWFCCEVDPIIQMHCHNIETISMESGAKFSKFLWTEGIWRIGSSVEDLDKLAGIFAEKMLHAQNSSLSQELCEPPIFKLTKQPMYSIVEQFISTHGDDPKYCEQVQIGKALLEVDFSNTLFSQPDIALINEELRNCGSSLEVIDSLDERMKDNFVYMPKPLQSLVKVTVPKSQSRRKKLTVFPSNSMKWMLLVCSLIFDKNYCSLLETVAIFENMYPKEYSEFE